MKTTTMNFDDGRGCQKEDLNNDDDDDNIDDKNDDGCGSKKQSRSDVALDIDRR